jgi:putative transposase
MSSRLRRYNLENCAYFVTTKTIRNKPYFTDHHLAELFVGNLYSCREKYRFLLFSFVLMPDHFHALITPEKGYTISGVIQKIKSLFVKKLREEMNWSGTFWQKSFYDFVIYREEKLLEKMNYILQNPVRKGIVETPEDYRFSTANNKFENDKDKFLK